MSLAQHMKDGAHLSLFAAFSFPDSKKYPFTAVLAERVFQLQLDPSRDLIYSRTSMAQTPLGP